ncbi:hypothetical protein Xmir_04056 [Xenorhabdus miraniensis]|uniref:Uncharacterized protein n=1 Tax=Xenorhabdus miraniensis TaxID=351674 RepID=A0A2D0JJZ0_9GAMM|nr:hypothetical protein Xmir_04056 [Xenorhabdus miraniensis]
MRTEHTRSIQTISHSTEVIDSFFDERSQKEFSVRRLSFRHDPNRQIFIVTISNDNKSDKFYVVPFAELTICRNKIRYLVKPTQQYPDLEDSFPSISSNIETAICDFIRNYRPACH